MEELWRQINQELWKIPTMDRDVAVSMLMQINSEDTAIEFLDYLATIDLTKTKYTPIIEKLEQMTKN